MGYYNFPSSTNKIKSFDEISTSEKNYTFWHFSVVGRVKLNFRDRYGKPNIYSKNSSCYQVFSSNSQKLSRGILIFQGVLTKFHILTKFPHLEKIVNLMKDLKYEHQSIFPLWGRVKLNFRDRYRKPHIYSKNSSCYQFFSSNSQKMTLWCLKKKNHYPLRCICIAHIWSPT